MTATLLAANAAWTGLVIALWTKRLWETHHYAPKLKRFFGEQGAGRRSCQSPLNVRDQRFWYRENRERLIRLR